MGFGDYLKSIAATEDTEALKGLAKEIYNNEELFYSQKNILLQSYKQKMQEVYRAYVKNSDNRLFKSLFFLIKKIPPAGEVGVILHELKDKFDRVERDILFQTYDKKKFSGGNGKAEAETEDNMAPF